MQAKEAFKEFCSKFSFPCTKQDAIDWVFNYTDQRYSRRYLKIFLEKIIVNNSSRVKMGSPADVFVLENGFLRPYSNQVVEKFEYNKDLHVQRERKLFDLKFEKIPLEKPKERSKFLIITNCSKTKNPGKLPSIQKYSSLAINFLKEISNCDIYIISAKHGLLYSKTEIQDYDQTFLSLSKLDLVKAGEELNLRTEIEELLSLNYEEVFFVMSNSYLRATNINKKSFSKGKKITVFVEKTDRDTFLHDEHNFINISREENSAAEIFKKAKACKEIIDNLNGQKKYSLFD